MIHLTTERLELIQELVHVASVVATVGVLFGVILEAKRFSESVQHKGWLLLVVSLAFEIPLGFAVISIDGAISNKEKREIAALQTRLLRTKKPRLFEVADQAAIGERLKPFSGVQYDVAFNLLDGEQDGFAHRLSRALGWAGWTRQPWPGATSVAGRVPSGFIQYVEGVAIQADPSQLERLRAAAEALVAVLVELDIDARLEPTPTVANSNPNTLHIIIGTRQ